MLTCANIGASSIHIGFGWPVAVPLTLPFSSVAMRLGPVLASPIHSCVGAAGRFAAVCCVRGGVFQGIKSSYQKSQGAYSRQDAPYCTATLCMRVE